MNRNRLKMVERHLKKKRFLQMLSGILAGKTIMETVYLADVYEVRGEPDWTFVPMQPNSEWSSVVEDQLQNDRSWVYKSKDDGAKQGPRNNLWKLNNTKVSYDKILGTYDSCCGCTIFIGEKGFYSKKSFVIIKLTTQPVETNEKWKR